MELKERIERMLNFLFANLKGDYLVRKEAVEPIGFLYVGDFSTQEEKVDLIQYFETMFLEEFYREAQTEIIKEEGVIL